MTYLKFTTNNHVKTNIRLKNLQIASNNIDSNHQDTPYLLLINDDYCDDIKLLKLITFLNLLPLFTNATATHNNYDTNNKSVHILSDPLITAGKEAKHTDNNECDFNNDTFTDTSPSHLSTTKRKETYFSPSLYNNGRSINVMKKLEYTVNDIPDCEIPITKGIPVNAEYQYNVRRLTMLVKLLGKFVNALRLYLTLLSVGIVGLGVCIILMTVSRFFINKTDDKTIALSSLTTGLE